MKVQVQLYLMYNLITPIVSLTQKTIGFVYLGCYREDGKDMTDLIVVIDDMTYEKCLITCMNKGYKFSGLHRASDEKSVECRCGQTYGARGHSKKDTCLFPCPGDKRQMCGSTDSSSIVFGYNGVDESYPGVNSASLVILIVASLWIVFMLVFIISFIFSMARVMLTKATSNDDE